MSKKEMNEALGGYTTLDKTDEIKHDATDESSGYENSETDEEFGHKDKKKRE